MFTFFYLLKVGEEMKIIKDQSGLTLVEVLMSLVLLAVVIIAFSGAFVNGMRSEVWVNNRLEAARLAESIAELIEENNSILLETDFSNIDGDLNNLVSEYENKISSSVSYSLEKSLVDSTNLNGLYQIKIVITWDAGSYELYTRIYAS